MKMPIIKNYEVLTSVDDWWEFSIKHKLITYKFINKCLCPNLMSLPFVTTITDSDKAYPLRVGIEGTNTRLQDDICLFYHKKKHKITIIQNYKDEYFEMEAKIIDVIKDSLVEWNKLKKNKEK